MFILTKIAESASQSDSNDATENIPNRDWLSMSGDELKCDKNWKSRREFEIRSIDKLSLRLEFLRKTFLRKLRSELLMINSVVIGLGCETKAWSKIQEF